MSKDYAVKSKVAFTGKRALTSVPGNKEFKPRDIRFFEGVSEDLPQNEAVAVAKQYGYRAVQKSAIGGGETETSTFDSIPGKDDLVAAGLDSMEKVVEYDEANNGDFSEIKGIGAATSDKINAFIAEKVV